MKMSELGEFLYELERLVNLRFDWANQQRGIDRTERWQGEKDVCRRIITLIGQYQDVPEIRAAINRFKEGYDVRLIIDARTGEPPDGSDWDKYYIAAERMLQMAEAGLVDSEFGTEATQGLRRLLGPMRDYIQLSIGIGK